METVLFFPPSYILEEGICYLALCDTTYPAKLAFSYLENLHKDFSEQHGGDVHKASRPYHFIEFGEELSCVLCVCVCVCACVCTCYVCSVYSLLSLASHNTTAGQVQ